MPMYDYLCSSCSHHQEHFFRMSTVPEWVECEKCKAAAPRTYDPEITLQRPRPALSFTPIVVHRTLAPDGSYRYSYPGRADDPVPHGYEKVELSTLSQADRFVRDRNQEEMELRRENINREESYWNARAQERRESVKRELEKRLGKSHSRIGELVQKAIDKRRANRYNELRSRNTNFHIQALSFDSSNRSEYRDDSSRKISVVVSGFRR